MYKTLPILAAVGLSLVLFSCATIPTGAQAVGGFDKARYLGSWYEIARLDFLFERGLGECTANYSPGKAGAIVVLNRGYDAKAGVWKEARGKARFRGADTRGELEVSFFGPFYAAYNVIALDPDYRSALVAGNNLKYLWILSREPTLPDSVRDQYLALATSLGYDTKALVWRDPAAAPK